MELACFSLSTISLSLPLGTKASSKERRSFSILMATSFLGLSLVIRLQGLMSSVFPRKDR